MSPGILRIALIVIIWTILGVFVAEIIGVNGVVYAGNGFYMLGFGPRVIGRSGADIAVADDAISINLNPAGMIRIEGQRLDICGGAGVSFTHFENDFNDEDGDPMYFFLPGVGYVNNPRDKRWAYGIVFYTPAGLGTSYSFQHPMYEDEIDYNDFFMSLRVSPAIAYQVTSRISVGFAPCLSYTRLDVEMPLAKSKNEVADICQGIAFQGTTFGALLKGFPVDEYTPLSELKGMESFGYGFSFGMLWESQLPTHRWPELCLKAAVRSGGKVPP